MFRRRRGSGNPVPLVMLDEGERGLVWQWWQLAADRLQAGPKETSWLTTTIMVQMTLGYEANHGPRVPALAYALATRTGYALRMFVGRFAAPRPLDVSSIDPESVATLATLPMDNEADMLADVTDEDEALLMPIVLLVSDTAEQAPLFMAVVSVEPALWNACVEVSVDQNPGRADPARSDPPGAGPEARSDRELPPLWVCPPLLRRRVRDQHVTSLLSGVRAARGSQLT
jgi:hypothetical protein